MQDKVASIRYRQAKVLINPTNQVIGNDIPEKHSMVFTKTKAIA